jgi:LacI family transcriptional regulator, repressor for deo operon, udp, cdd, tsx, nupC, and nupG
MGKYILTEQRRITISDVVREAGVSSGTVSRVLNPPNGKSRISKATQQKVLDVVKRLGYQPNPFASALRAERSGVIGAIIRDINDPFLSLLARELQRVAHENDIELLMGHAGNNPDAALRQLAFMQTWFDGMLIIGDMPGMQAMIDSLNASGRPFANLACGSQAAPPSINIDEALGTRLILDYLYTLGHRRVAFVGDLEHEATKERLTHFRDYIAENGMIWDEDYLQPTQYHRSAAIASTHRLLSLSIPPTAIFCTADLLALGAISGAAQIGWRVPEAVSIISFDDIEESNTSFPALTTLRQPVGDMANAAIDLLIELMDGHMPDREHCLIVPPHLIVRRSCAPPFSSV